jgi:hypothetical protein
VRETKKDNVFKLQRWTFGLKGVFKLCEYIRVLIPPYTGQGQILYTNPHTTSQLKCTAYCAVLFILMKVKKTEELLRLCYLTGVNAVLSGVAKAGQRFGVQIQVASYWQTKVTDHSFHAGKHGGIR